MNKAGFTIGYTIGRVVSAMFKTKKRAIYSVLTILVVGMFFIEPHEDSVFAKSEAKTETKIEEPVQVVKKELTAFEKEELELKKKQSAIRSVANQLTGVCMQKIRASAKYPNKVDFHAFTTSQAKTWNNFNGGEHEFPHRYHYRVNGEMMNGLGLMIPFQSSCKIDFNEESSKYTTVEILVL